MGTLRWTLEARVDLKQIGEFYADQRGKQFGKLKTGTIMKELLRLADEPMLGLRDAGLGDPYRYWHVLGNEYRVYFDRLGPSTIRVLRIWSNRREPLKPKDILV